MSQQPQRTPAYRAKTIAELRSLSEEELIRAHDELATSISGVQVGVNYYREELARRTTEQQGKRIERLTWALVFLTLVLVVLTAVLVWPAVGGP